MEEIGVVLIGDGYWGPNLALNIALNSNYSLIAAVDQDETRRSLANSTYGSFAEIDTAQRIELTVICTRPSSHKALAEHFIKNHVNVLITKPCGTSSLEPSEIANLAEEYGVQVFCDFTYHFSPLVNFLIANKTARQIVEDMLEYGSYRTALGIVQSDVDVLADLAVHDIYILLLLKGKLPNSVQCLQTNSSSEPRLHAAFNALTWDDGFVATIHVSWNSPKKVRLISITSHGHGILLEEMNREAPVQLVHFAPKDADYADLTADERYTRNVSFTMGNLEVPSIDMYEALSLEMESIAISLRSVVSSAVLPNARSAMNVWKVVEALRQSNLNKGVTQYV